MIFDLRNRENRIAISLDGKLEREDQEFIYAQMTIYLCPNDVQEEMPGDYWI